MKHPRTAVNLIARYKNETAIQIVSVAAEIVDNQFLCGGGVLRVPGSFCDGSAVDDNIWFDGREEVLWPGFRQVGRSGSDTRRSWSLLGLWQ